MTALLEYNNVLKVCGGPQVRQIYFPDHVTPARILEMAHYCVKVTHLSLPQDTQLALDHLEQIVHTMTQLQQLDVFAYGNLIQEENPMMPGGCIKRLLKATVGSVKELKLRIYGHNFDLVYRNGLIKVTLYHRSLIFVLKVGCHLHLIMNCLNFGQYQVLNCHHLKLMCMITKIYRRIFILLYR